MNFFDVNLESLSELKCTFSVTENFGILYLKVVGKYGYGSRGNGDGDYLFTQLAAHFYAYDPITIIVDLQEMEYEWGDLLSKTLRFFKYIGRDEHELEQVVNIVVSEQNENAIKGLLNFFGDDKLCFHSMEEAKENALKVVRAYMDDEDFIP